jgi:NAD(P)-dependent dehydrogenase (short-subunit alcohol dehydrogenase family)
MESTEQRVVAITGASSGMGREAVLCFAAHGWRVVAGARRVELIPSADGVTALRLDVTDDESCQAFVAAIADGPGRLDVLINDAGFSAFGPVETMPVSDVRALFETNVLGAVRLTRLALPLLRSQGFGRVVNISSISADMYLPFGAAYHASKAALQTWSDCLDAEIRPLGLRSVVVQPGATSSNVWVDKVLGELADDSPYRPLALSLKQVFGKVSGGAAGETAAGMAVTFYQAATRPRARLRNHHSLADGLLVRVVRNHPAVYAGLVIGGLVYAATRQARVTSVK